MIEAFAELQRKVVALAKTIVLAPMLITADRARAERSKFLWRPDGPWFVLSLLGVFNSVLGWCHLGPVTMKAP